VGVSVVNALSLWLEVEVTRVAAVCTANAFEHGEKRRRALRRSARLARHRHAAALRPDPKAYFDAPQVQLGRLKHLLRAKAVLCPGLDGHAEGEPDGDAEVWCYEGGLVDYLAGHRRLRACSPEEPFVGHSTAIDEAVDWAVQWLPDGGEQVQESYVNLIPRPRAAPT
jgi:topoisomerase-4 subunit B